ncbi:hypothetical protein B0H17DRAFT_1201237 [Mycena rosella]|uniref:Uncharacterized protein n=1 Tax=Mycena rosella TaxID=1033263 RepID=A0AAD7DGX0_MYCRO|nr:hypothetical protein B0H17DRAFT_1201237 [Mycena rosella]
MSTTRTISTRQIMAAFSPFSDATNKINGGIFPKVAMDATGKPLSRRVARQHTKKNAPGRVQTKAERATITSAASPPEFLEPLSSAAKASYVAAIHAISSSLPGSGWHDAAVLPPPSLPVPPPAPLPRRIPVCIVRTLPLPPPPKFHGSFDACSRADLLVDEEPRTCEEDAWGIIYPEYGPSDLAVSIAGPVRVFTFYAAPGAPGSVQIIYG